MLLYHIMHSNTDFKSRTTKGGSVILLKKIKTKPLPLEITGGAILSNRNIGITSNSSPVPLSRSMASVGGMIDFNKHVKTASRNLQKKKDKDENIKFVY
jgi:hypothetical protein